MTSLPHEFESSFFDFEQLDKIGIARMRRERLSEEDNVEQLGIDLLAVVDQLGYRQVVVSLSPVQYVTSSIIGKMIHLHRHLKRLGGALILCDVNATVMDVMEISRLDNYFHIESDVEKSVANLSS